MLPEHCHKGDGLCLVTYNGGNTITHSLPPVLFPTGAATTSCALRDILVLETQRA